MSEMSERNFFHRSGPTVRDPRVMHDLAIAEVDSVMRTATAGCDQAQFQRGFLLGAQELFQGMIHLRRCQLYLCWYTPQSLTASTPAR